MSVTASPARATASCAAATNDRPAGTRRNSDVGDKNPRRGDGRLPDITHSIPARTLPEHINSQATVCPFAHTGPDLYAGRRGASSRFLELIAEGLTNTEIATRLCLSDAEDGTPGCPRRRRWGGCWRMTV